MLDRLMDAEEFLRGGINFQTSTSGGKNEVNAI
jgi:hypothetical protein